MQAGQLADRLRQTLGSVFDGSSPLIHRSSPVYFYAGVGGPIGSEDSDPVPKLWFATGEIRALLGRPEFESLCASFDLRGLGSVATTLRGHATGLMNACDQTHSQIETIRREASTHANAACFRWLDVVPTIEHETVISWSAWKHGSTFEGPVEGDAAKRAALGEAMSHGPPDRWTIHLRPFMPTTAEEAAERYWSILRDANWGIQNVRMALRKRIESFIAYLEAIDPPDVSEDDDNGSSSDAHGNPTLHASTVGIALTPDHESMLEALRKTPTKCRTIIQIASAGPIRNRETVGRLLGELADYGMVHRPHGTRKGYALTDEGRKWLPGGSPT